MENEKVYPLISVLMPAFNAEKYLDEAVESILGQSYPHFELLIGNDGSTDNTLKLASSYSDSRIKISVNNNSNIGKPLTVNKLYEFSKGDILTIHDADDISLKHRFEKIAEKFTNPDINICGHIIERISENGKPLGLFREKSDSYNAILKSMKSDNTDGDPSLFFRRKVCEKLEGKILRPYFQNNMDYDMALRMMEIFPATNVLEVLSYYRNVPNSISKGISTYKKLVTQDMTKFFADERVQKGTDSLMEGNTNVIEQKELEFSEKYRKDKTLFLREMASFYMYVKMEKLAIKNMLKAISIDPFKFENWHTLQYCLRKLLFRI